MLPAPKDEREAVAGVFAIARNVSVPFGAPDKPFGIYNTEYRTVMNLTDKRYYFELTTAPNVIWADLLQDESVARLAGDGAQPGRHRAVGRRHRKIQGGEGGVLERNRFRLN